MRQLLLLLLTTAGLIAADPPKITVDGGVPPPVIQLPPFKPSAVAAFDATKVKEVPWDLKMVKVPEAWAKSPAAKGKGVKVAILDTGVQHDHPGLNGMVKAEYNAITKKAGKGSTADGHGHGTWCVGAVHAVVPDADLYSVKVLTDKGSGSVADIAHGIDYAVTEWQVDVISLSLGSSQADTYLPPAIRRAVAAGVVVIAAAGNDGGGEGRYTEGYPGRYPECVSVAACDRNRQLAEFSSWGPNVFTTDPGVDVTGLLPGSKEGEMSGTSMACPKEAGKCASWMASNAIPREKDRADHFRAAVIKASPFPERNNARGYGLYTLDKITGDGATQPPPVKPTPGEKVYTLSLAELQRQGYTSVRIDLGAGATSTQPIPVANYPVPQPAPQYQPAPVFTGPGTVYQGHYPPPVIYQQMPSQCGPGGCQPASQPQYLFAPFGGRFR